MGSFRAKLEPPCLRARLQPCRNSNERKAASAAEVRFTIAEWRSRAAPPDPALTSSPQPPTTAADSSRSSATPPSSSKPSTTLPHQLSPARLRSHARPPCTSSSHQPTSLSSERCRLIKGGYSHRLASKLPVWQRGFTDHRIRDDADYNIRRNYLHQNPVAAPLCESTESYPFSSANPKLRLDEYLSG